MNRHDTGKRERVIGALVGNLMSFTIGYEDSTTPDDVRCVVRDDAVLERLRSSVLFALHLYWQRDDSCVELLDTLVWDYMQQQRCDSSLEILFVSHLVYSLVEANDPTVEDVKQSISQALDQAIRYAPETNDSCDYLESLTEVIYSAIMISDDRQSDDIASLDMLLDGVAEGPSVWSINADSVAVAVAIYCILRHYDDIDRAFAVAMSYSMRLNALAVIVVFNIMGAAKGVKALPEQSRKTVETHPIMRQFMNYVWGDEEMFIC